MSAVVAESDLARLRYDYTISEPERHFLLFLDGVQVVFDGFRALDIGALGVYYNELRVVIGPNGAGKTTMCDVVSGRTKPASGRVFFDGADITHRADSEIARMGVGRKFQTPTVFDSLTVYENMELALPERRGVWPNLWKKETGEQRDRILQLIERIRLLGQLNTQAKYLSHGQRQWLEICMLILASPKLLLVDEPAAGLTDRETELTAELLLGLKGEHSIIVIEHDMDFVRMLDARVTVLHAGKVLADGPMAQVQADERVIEAYLGR